MAGLKSLLLINSLKQNFSRLTVYNYRQITYKSQLLNRDDKQPNRISKKDINPSSSGRSSESTPKNNVGDAEQRSYKYFTNLMHDAKSGEITRSNVDCITTDMLDKKLDSDSNNTSALSDSNRTSNISSELVDLPPSLLKPAIPKTSFNLAAYVNENITLTNLVKLGVDLSKVEKDVDVAEFLVKADFESSIKPYITFLIDQGVGESDLGDCITHFAAIFLEPLDDLQIRVNYLAAKHFSRESIVSIITKAPSLLGLPVKKIDAHLGNLQQLFRLSGDEVRAVVTRYPKIATWNKVSIQVIQFAFKDELGFTAEQSKEMLLMCPKLFLSNKYSLIKRFDYLHSVIGYSREDLMVWPQVLRIRQSHVSPRYQFLKLIGRDQFDAKKENYVSLKLLVMGRDAEFCENVAKVPVARYNEFLKTL